MSRWSWSIFPWFTLAIAVLSISNPLGIAVVRAALNPSPTDWLASFWQMAFAVALASVILIAVVEILVRRRLWRRRRERLARQAGAEQLSSVTGEGATRG
jgi:membrane protein YdbS with pleckstrin-like domain